MRRAYQFFKRNLKELIRDPILYVFCAGFPLVMILMFFTINKFMEEQSATFHILSLLPGIIVFSYSFVMLAMSLLVSKDKQTLFIKRLYASPMKEYDFIIGYSLVGILIGIIQTILCVLASLVIAFIEKEKFINFGEILVLISSQLPLLVFNVFIGILFGTLLNDKSAPGISSILISLSGIFGGCWMPIEAMGGLEVFCKFLPYYPSVYIGRIITGAKTVYNEPFLFENLGILPIIMVGIYLLTSIVSSILLFKKKMINDK